MPTEPTFTSEPKLPPAPEGAQTTADQSEGDSTTALYRAAIGRVNTAYYLPRFTRFEAADRAGISWNWSAALCTLSWMAYRQLWSAALTYAGALVGLALLVFGIGGLVLRFSELALWAGLAAFVVAAVMVPGLYGNAVFYAQCRTRMAHALRINDTLPEACAMLTRQASSLQRLAWLSLANAAIGGLVVIGYLNFPKASPLPDSMVAPTQAHNLAINRALDAASAPAPAMPAMPAASAAIAATSAPAVPASAVVTQVAEVPAPMASASAAAIPKEEFVAPAVKTEAVAKPAVKAVVKPVQKAKVNDKPAAVAAKSAAPAPAKAKAVEKAATASTEDPQYAINVGLFADDNNARNAYVKLTDAALPATRHELKTKKGVMTRVRVGPFDTEREAEAAAQKIRALGLDALIFKQ